MRTARRPPHLLLFDHPFGDQLIDGGFNEPRRDPFLAAIPLAIVGDPGRLLTMYPLNSVSARESFFKTACFCPPASSSSPRALTLPRFHVHQTHAAFRLRSKSAGDR